MRIIYMVMQSLSFFQQVNSNDLSKYTSNSSKVCVLEVDLEYPKELQELQNDFALAPEKIEIKKEMLSEY